MPDFMLGDVYCAETRLQMAENSREKVMYLHNVMDLTGKEHKFFVTTSINSSYHMPVLGAL